MTSKQESHKIILSHIQEILKAKRLKFCSKRNRSISDFNFDLHRYDIYMITSCPKIFYMYEICAHISIAEIILKLLSEHLRLLSFHVWVVYALFIGSESRLIYFEEVFSGHLYRTLWPNVVFF